ncbi:hypothetical protein [Vibrio coralliilyticus]|uniref:hypothetical protein n=1 Tax=Vibrio coralliilyticus TaxID=190893 RepID=UPI0006CDE33A|nr:hypothetical protein [Vibrio coralliilyticus]AXN31625.1 hypothetical protein DVV14_10015 [Vibrio coralliilyticus]KPH28002.1 hypothetical protein ADU60_07100 [Vibrio coralliilyticus]
MILYKYVPEREIADVISRGNFRFYELVKYIDIEDISGRSDPHECSINIQDHEWEKIEELPVVYLDDLKLHFSASSPSKEHISNYFVFCVSSKPTSNAIADSNYEVSFNVNVFETLGKLLLDFPFQSDDRYKLFSHGPVKYYNIKSELSPIQEERWQEVYLKHSDFSYQNEYRAALFLPPDVFEMVDEAPMSLDLPVNDAFGNRLPYNLEFEVRAGVDNWGWRYVELDLSKVISNAGIQFNMTSVS